MAMGVPTAMHIDAVLTLTQWLSPAYPVGAFAYSHGLESLADDRRLCNGADLRDWLKDVLRHGAGRSDALLLAAAWHARDAAEVNRVDQTARAFAPSRERLFETVQQGGAFGKMTGAIWGDDLDRLTYPVALGRAAALQSLPLDLTLRMFLQAMLSNLISAGQRLLPVGQTEAQTLLRDLTPLCHDISEQAASGDLISLSSTAFLGDIASMRHETQYSRIFRT